MHRLSAVVLLSAALGASVIHAQTAPAGVTTRSIKAVQPGLFEVAGPRVNEALAAGITKIVAAPGKGGKSIEVQSPWGFIFFAWPKDVKPVAFTITTGKAGGAAAEISAPGFTEGNKGDYKAALDAVIPMAISKAAAQKTGKTDQAGVGASDAGRDSIQRWRQCSGSTRAGLDPGIRKPAHSLNRKELQMLKPLKPLVTAAFAVAAVVFTNAPATAQGGATVMDAGPGKAGMMQTLNVTATITAIDKAKRDVTLKGPQGNLLTVTAGPAVKNFDKLKVGDQVDMKYVEAVTMELKKGGGMIVSRTEQKGAVGAKPGATPAGMMGREVTIVADVVAVDPAKQMITLKGPVHSIDLRVDNPEQFKRIAKGDQVEAKFTQALAVSVEPKK